DQKGGPRMCHSEGNRCKRALSLVAMKLVAADPVVSLVLTLHVVATASDGIAPHRLALEGFTFSRPVLERAGLEIEVERLAVGTQGQNTLGWLRSDGQHSREHDGARPGAEHDIPPQLRDKDQIKAHCSECGLIVNETPDFNLASRRSEA